MTRLKGSCHCGAVRFECDSEHPYPYQHCYCSICRKTAGGGGYAVNLSADARTLQVEGKESLAVYNAKMPDGKVSEGERNFCKNCASCLWLFDPRWPDLCHPFASAVNSELSAPPERTHLMLAAKPAWVQPPFGPHDKKFDGYPEESIADWHKRHDLEG